MQNSGKGGGYFQYNGTEGVIQTQNTNKQHHLLFSQIMILWSKISSGIGISIVSWASFVLSKQIILTLWNISKGTLAPFHINQKIIENTYLKSVGFCSQCCSRPSRLFGLTNWKFVIVGYHQHFILQQKPLSHWLIKIDYCTARHVSCWNCRLRKNSQ